MSLSHAHTLQERQKAVEERELQQPIRAADEAMSSRVGLGLLLVPPTRSPSQLVSAASSPVSPHEPAQSTDPVCACAHSLTEAHRPRPVAPSSPPKPRTRRPRHWKTVSMASNNSSHASYNSYAPAPPGIPRVCGSGADFTVRLSSRVRLIVPPRHVPLIALHTCLASPRSRPPSLPSSSGSCVPAGAVPSLPVSHPLPALSL